MTITKSTKLFGAAILTLGFAVSASAGDKTNCDDKKHSAMQKTQASQTSAVIPANAEVKSDRAQKKTYTFEEAMAKCQKYGATDLKACIDKKTGVTKEKS